MPRVSATSPPIRLGTTSLAAPEVARSGGEGASACTVMAVSISLLGDAAGQNPLPVTPLMGVATSTLPPSSAVPVATSSTGAGAADGTPESVPDSIEPTCWPPGSTIQPALILAPRTIAMDSYSPDGLCT